jgi:polysaccharide export outer membrane protein
MLDVKFQRLVARQRVRLNEAGYRGMERMNPSAFAAFAMACAVTFSSLSTFANSQDEGYRINSEDLLEISVWKEPDLQREVIVRPDGGITMPLIGDVKAAGLTPRELQDVLIERLSEYVPDPVLTVTVVEIRGFKIYVAGEVNNPGEYAVGRYIDVLQALTMAGGVTAFADESSVRVLRRSGGTNEVFLFNFSQVQKGRSLDQNIRLLPGDTVIVP